MKTLYCFKFDTLTGDVTRVSIPDYKEVKVNNREGFKFRSDEIVLSEQIFFVEKKKLDRLCTNKVYTFHPEFEKARMIIGDRLLQDMKEAQRKAKRCAYLLNKLEGGKDNGPGE